jgi:hypothetical protein
VSLYRPERVAQAQPPRSGRRTAEYDLRQDGPPLYRLSYPHVVEMAGLEPATCGMLRGATTGRGEYTGRWASHTWATCQLSGSVESGTRRVDDEQLDRNSPGEVGAGAQSVGVVRTSHPFVLSR